MFIPYNGLTLVTYKNRAVCCAVCKLPIYRLAGSSGMGYGVTSSNRKVCYDCCAIADNKRMHRHGRIDLYFSVTASTPDLVKHVVTNWPGTLSYAVTEVRLSQRNAYGRRVDFWFRDDCGDLWHGILTGGSNQLAKCTRLKSALRRNN